MKSSLLEQTSTLKKITVCFHHANIKHLAPRGQAPAIYLHRACVIQAIIVSKKVFTRCCSLTTFLNSRLGCILSA